MHRAVMKHTTHFRPGGWPLPRGGEAYAGAPACSAALQQGDVQAAAPHGGGEGVGDERHVAALRAALPPRLLRPPQAPPRQPGTAKRGSGRGPGTRGPPAAGLVARMAGASTTHTTAHQEGVGSFSTFKTNQSISNRGRSLWTWGKWLTINGFGQTPKNSPARVATFGGSWPTIPLPRGDAEQKTSHSL